MLRLTDGRWEDADGVRKLIDETGLRKMFRLQKIPSTRRWFVTELT